MNPTVTDQQPVCGYICVPDALNDRGPFEKYGLLFIQAWINKHMPSKEWDRITRCIIVDWTLQSNYTRNSNIFIQGDVFEYVVWKMSDILSRPQCIKTTRTQAFELYIIRQWLCGIPIYASFFECFVSYFDLVPTRAKPFWTKLIRPHRTQTLGIP